MMWHGLSVWMVVPPPAEGGALTRRGAARRSDRTSLVASRRQPDGHDGEGVSVPRVRNESWFRQLIHGYLP